jgi:CRP/FNR family transcriptional regulator, cyclic AMP receptor protein
MFTQEEFTLLFGAIGALLTILSNLMQRMVPLRMFAVFANLFFALFGYLAHDRVQMILQLSLFAINAYRLWDLKRLLIAMASAHSDTPLQNWLLPHMKKKRFKAGATLFSKGDNAHQLIYINKGTVRITEIDQTLGAGNLVGEIGLFTEDRKRTATIVCETDCICYTMTDEAIYLMYFQNPQLGFFLIRLIVQRLLQDLQRRPDAANA